MEYEERWMELRTIAPEFHSPNLARVVRAPGEVGVARRFAKAQRKDGRQEGV